MGNFFICCLGVLVLEIFIFCICGGFVNSKSARKRRLFRKGMFIEVQNRYVNHCGKLWKKDYEGAIVQVKPGGISVIKDDGANVFFLFDDVFGCGKRNKRIVLKDECDKIVKIFR